MLRQEQFYFSDSALLSHPSENTAHLQFPIKFDRKVKTSRILISPEFNEIMLGWGKWHQNHSNRKKRCLLGTGDFTARRKDYLEVPPT